MTNHNPTDQQLFNHLNREGFAARPATDILDELLDLLPLLDVGRVEELAAAYLQLHGE